LLSKSLPGITTVQKKHRKSYCITCGLFT